MESLLKEILEDLKTELSLKNDSDTAVLCSKIKNAIREVKMKRNYPSYFLEEQIISDLNRHYSNIRELALYDFNQVGAEGQTSHNANGTSRSWKSRNECLIGVFAYCNQKIVRELLEFIEQFAGYPSLGGGGQTEFMKGGRV